LFHGTLATGETIFKVLPVDPEAATRPRRAIGPGRYVLSDSVHLAVQRLSKMGLLSLHPTATDRREKLVALTVRGREALLLAEQQVRKMEQDMASVIGPEGLETLRATLKVLLRHVVAQRKSRLPIRLPE
jgi:DNA-binding MarR family transcriptional regulator